jgi:hypothetical protein
MILHSLKPFVRALRINGCYTRRTQERPHFILNGFQNRKLSFFQGRAKVSLPTASSFACGKITDELLLYHIVTH